MKESEFQPAFGPSQTDLIFLLYVWEKSDSAYECLFLRASHFSTVFNGFLKVPICPTYLIKKSKIKNHYLGPGGVEKKVGKNDFLMSRLDLTALLMCPKK